MLQGEQDIRFLESMFKRHYYKSVSDIPVPGDIASREFGYQKFGASGMIRHIQVKNAGEMRVLFVRNVPSDAYCSNAYYSYPDLDMGQKDWRGADLIFDIDAKDLDLPCRPSHTVEVCDECNKAFSVQAAARSEEEQSSPTGPDAGTGDPKGRDGDNGDGGSDKSGKDACRHPRARRKSLPCKTCMDASKEQVSRLLDILQDDLGVPHGAATTYFSGNEGFHLHVSHAAFREMDSRGRADLVDYIRLQGLMPETMGMKKAGPDKSLMPDLDEKGWRGRFAKHAFGSKSRRSALISELSKNPESAYSEFEGIVRDAASAIGVRVDPSVTMDIHRVFRMPHTLNSKSGMLKVRCGDLDAFDPYGDATVVLDDDPVRVVADCPVRFSLRKRRFGPYHNDAVKVPGYAAAYMICKGVARIDAEGS